MFRPRIIPVLLLKGTALVKSIKFKDHRYIGDPINAVKIFNDLRADELVFLDISATREKRLIDLGFVREVGEEANMPFAVGGGVRTLEDIRRIVEAGAERVVLNTVAAETPDFVRQASEAFGSSTIAVCVDVKRKWFGPTTTWSAGGSRASGLSPVEFAQRATAAGAGEIILQSIERDGTMAGYDLALIRSVSEAVTVPVVALGGAGGLEDMQKAYTLGFASGLAAGSFFVYHGPKRGVLINYPERAEIGNCFAG